METSKAKRSNGDFLIPDMSSNQTLNVRIQNKPLKASKALYLADDKDRVVRDESIRKICDITAGDYHNGKPFKS